MKILGKLATLGAIGLGLTLTGTAPSAFAQASPDSAMTPAPASSADTAGMAPPNDPAQTVVAGQAPPAQVQALASGDNKTVTNGPVPDTKANRARFGRPMSNAGKKSPPAGN